MKVVYTFFLFTLLILIIFMIFFLKKKWKEKVNKINDYSKMILETANHVSLFERDRIAKYLHDEIGTKLSIAHLNLTKISRNSNNVLLCEELTKENIQIISSIIENVRNLSKNVWQQSINIADYKNKILELCRQINSSEQISLELTKFPETIYLSETLIFDLSMVTCEAINNIVKHANATKLSISIQVKNNVIETILAHNGISFSKENKIEVIKKNVGCGLKNIQSITDCSDITIKYLSVENGAQTVILLPYDREN